MKVQIRKWGNSLALRIPKAFAADTQITEGTTVDVTMSNNSILVKPAKAELTLDALLEQVTEENVHGESDFGGPKGKEVW